MEFRGLRYFLAVYEELSFTGASKRCFVAQPSISSAVQQLESELNCQLFIRNPKGVTPTLAANTLYPFAYKVLEEIQSIKGLFVESAPSVSLKISLMPFLSGQRVCLIINELVTSISGLDLTIVDLTEEADARIVSNNLVAQNESFHKLWHDKFVLALPLGHPFTLLSSVPMEMLNNIPFISRQPCDVINSWNYAVQRSNISINTKAVVKTEEYALDLVAAGLGVSLVPSHSTGLRQDIVTREVTGLELERTIGLAYVKGHPLPAQLLTSIDNAKKRIMSSFA
ncbi:MAG: LysR family transcriptional regulator [Chlorobium sp.]|nr:LysR family transcriptional regulator [Chlorobium sp.]